MPKFCYNDQEREVLKNFSKINPSMIIQPDKFNVINNSKNVLGFYDFENPYYYEEYGIYDLGVYNNYMRSVTDLELEVKEKCVVIYDKASNLKQTQSTTPVDGGSLVRVTDPASQFNACEVIVETAMPSDKLSQLLKFADIAKHERIFFKTINGILTLIGGGKDLNNSIDPTLIDIKKNNITTNKLDVTLSMSKEFMEKLMEGYDYTLTIVKTGKGNYISRWSNDVVKGLRYYISLEISEG